MPRTIATVAESARILGISRATAHRYIARHPEVRSKSGKVVVPRLAKLVKKRRTQPRRNKWKVDFPSPGAVRRAFDHWQRALGDSWEKRWTPTDRAEVAADLRPVVEFWERIQLPVQAHAAQRRTRENRAISGS